MKKLTIILFAILVVCGFACSSCSYSHKQQDNDSDTTSTYAAENIDPENIHFQFMGIPIHGTPEQFEEGLKSKGFLATSGSDSYLGNYWGQFFDTYVYVTAGYEKRVNKVYEVEVKFHNYSLTNRENLLKAMIKKYSNLGAGIREDTGGDYEFIIWTPEGENSHPEFDKNEISSSEIKGVIVFENDGDDLILRYIDVLNKNLHFAVEDDEL